MDFLKSSEAAKRMGVSYWTLIGLMRSRLIEPPAKDSSGDFVWLPEDMDRARAALAARRRQKPKGVTA